jgi:hypothetical protein
MSINLAERALAAWAEQQDRERRERLARVDAATFELKLLANNLLVAVVDDAVEHTHEAIAERWTVGGTVDQLLGAPEECVAECEIDGLRFEVSYRTETEPSGWALTHWFRCEACGRGRESWPLASLADLGRWLEYQIRYCGHLTGVES